MHVSLLDMVSCLLCPASAMSKGACCLPRGATIRAGLDDTSAAWVRIFGLQHPRPHSHEKVDQAVLALQWLLAMLSVWLCSVGADSRAGVCDLVAWG